MLVSKNELFYFFTFGSLLTMLKILLYLVTFITNIHISENKPTLNFFEYN